MKAGSSDLAPVTPGKPEHSELFRLLTTKNAKDGKSGEKKKSAEPRDFDGDIFKLIESRNKLFSSCSDGIIRLHSLPERKELRTFTGLGDLVYAPAVNGNNLAAGGYNGEIWGWELPTGKLLSTFSGAPGLASTKQAK